RRASLRIHFIDAKGECRRRGIAVLPFGLLVVRLYIGGQPHRIVPIRFHGDEPHHRNVLAGDDRIRHSDGLRHPEEWRRFLPPFPSVRRAGAARPDRYPDRDRVLYFAAGQSLRPSVCGHSGRTYHTEGLRRFRRVDGWLRHPRIAGRGVAAADDDRHHRPGGSDGAHSGIHFHHADLHVSERRATSRTLIGW